jgi:ABC-2 type transport system permease protein
MSFARDTLLIFRRQMRLSSRDVSRATPFGYIINAMRQAYAGHYFNNLMVKGIGVAIGLAAVCLWLAGRAFTRENA